MAVVGQKFVGIAFNLGSFLLILANAKEDVMPVKEFGAPLGEWREPPHPDRSAMKGHWVSLEPIDSSRHAEDLFRANSVLDEIWDYLPYGPFANLERYTEWLDSMASKRDPLFFAVCPAPHGSAEGVMSFLRIDPVSGSIEVGHINFSVGLQRSVAATEALFLMMQWAFEEGYRRFEWKCDALNLGSRRAAQRFGFSFEGVFRQATHYKGRNRDTAWFACIDIEWPELKSAYQKWFAPENFDTNGRQLVSLSDLTRPILVKCDPAIC